MSAEQIYYGKHNTLITSRWESQEGAVDFEHWLCIEYDESVHIALTEKVIESESSRYSEGLTRKFNHPCTFELNLFKEHQDEILEVSYNWLARNSLRGGDFKENALLTLYLKIASYLNSSSYELVEYRSKIDSGLLSRSLHHSEYKLIISPEITLERKIYEIDRVEYQRVHTFTEPTFIYFLGNYKYLEEPEYNRENWEDFWGSLDDISRANVSNMLEG